MKFLNTIKNKLAPKRKASENQEPAEVRKWLMIVDVALCEDCNNCFLACKDEHVDNDFPGYALAQPLKGHRWMNVQRRERGRHPMVDVSYLPAPCQHCDNAPCIKAAADGAVYKREDGLVIIDPVKAKGREDIVKSCPYEAIWWNAEKQVPQKCTFCAHLLDGGWSKPRCVQSCPTGALKVVRAGEAELEGLLEKEGLDELKPGLKTQPRVLYKNLHQYARCFIGGSVFYKKDGLEECAEGARVSLIDSSGQTVAVVDTDKYGDFKFNNLKEDSGRYTIEVSLTGREKKILETDLKNSLYLGALEL